MRKVALKKVIPYAMFLLAGILIGKLSVPVYQLVTAIVVGRHIQTTYVSEVGHIASLYKKHNLADINFIVDVDGITVFRSADLMPFPDHLYRETLVWDTTGRVVVFEMMGRRIWAYDAKERRQLNANELESYKLWPALADDYFYVNIRDLKDQ